METITRYVITHISKAHKLRVLTFAAQGRHTYETEAEAVRMLEIFKGPQGLCKILNVREVDSLKVVPCPCYPGHFDPCKTCWSVDDEI